MTSVATLVGRLARVLAAIGLYAETAYTVAQPTTEIGIRTAVGVDDLKVFSLCR